jgi:hypothetical protein
MNFSSNDVAVWKQIRRLRATGRETDGFCKKLKCYSRGEVDLFAWIEPTEATWELSSESEVRIYVACVNVGYHSVVVTHGIESKHGAVLVESDGEIHKDQEVDEENFGYLNWDFKRLTLATADARDDLFFRWRIEGVRGAETYSGVVKIKTL